MQIEIFHRMLYLSSMLDNSSFAVAAVVEGDACPAGRLLGDNGYPFKYVADYALHSAHNTMVLIHTYVKSQLHFVICLSSNTKPDGKDGQVTHRERNLVDGFCCDLALYK